MGIKLTAVVVSVAAMVLLAGCVGTPAPDSSTRAPTTHATPTPTPLDPQDPATWTVSDAGIGPFALGASLSSIRPAQPLLVDDDGECPNPLVTFLHSSRVHVSVVVDAAGNIAGVDVGNPPQDGSDVPIASPASGPHTVSGIGIGSTVSLVTAAYPSATLQKFFPDGDYGYYVVKNANGNWISLGTSDTAQKIDDIGVWPGSLPPYEWCG